MKRLHLITIILLALFTLVPASALAQTYLFSLDELTVHVYWNEDGTSAIDYVFVFTNDPSASPIDYVDVGIPNSNFNEGDIIADVDGQPLSDISRSGYQGTGDSGVAVGLGRYAIQPGHTGRVHVFIPQVREVLYPDEDDPNYVSAVFVPTWFGSQYVYGSTNMTVAFHFPPGVGPDEPRWHAAPPGFPSEPGTGFDEQDRVVYTWHNGMADGSQQYTFGASFPQQYVPADAIVRPSSLENIFAALGIAPGDLFGLTCCLGFIGFWVVIIGWGVYSGQRRKLQYLPPKIAIEGLGIKRGLTAVEAAILMEEPMDKILTMILFSVIKKGAASVVKQDPLQLKQTEPLPEGLQAYEQDFLKAFQETDRIKRRKALQEMTVDLVKGVSAKMKGFSRRETIAYYRDIVKRAWAQVEGAQTPEVKSEKFEEVMEWTMLDKDYGDRTREVFRTGPVYLPTWWGRFDPTFGRPVGTGGAKPMASPVSTPGGGVSLPSLPGSAFAASMVNSVQNFSSSVIGNVSEFTSNITNRTNPVPVTRSSSSSGSRSGGGCACACACACAGCACACAGGGR